MTIKTAQRSLAENMRRLRALRGVDQEEASERANIHVRHWQKIEAGEINVTLRTLVGIARALRTTLPRLFAPVRKILMRRPVRGPRARPAAR